MAVHLYGVLAKSIPALRVEGRGGARVRLVTADGLAVAVSDVDEHARAGAADLLAHARVLELCLEKTTVVPMRFGIMLEDDDQVRQEVLNRDHDQLVELLRLFDGLVQVSVRVLQDEEPALREVLERRPDLKELSQSVRETVPAAPMSEKIYLGESVTHALTELASEYAASVMPRLASVARAAICPQPQGVLEVLNGSYLVARAERGQFDEVVADVRREFSGRLSIRYVGPQPPYAFLDVAQEGRASWA